MTVLINEGEIRTDDVGLDFDPDVAMAELGIREAIQAKKERYEALVDRYFSQASSNERLARVLRGLEGLKMVLIPRAIGNI
jgi:hypothetical protein